MSLPTPPPPPEHNEAYSASRHTIQGAGENVHEAREAVNKATASISNLLSGNGNMVDAAVAVKGAYDNVVGLTGRLSATAMMPVMKALAAFKGQAILPAGKQMDPVMGIDVHMVTIPPSPAPVPMPHPYIGILFNAKDWVSCAINTFKKDILDALPEPAEGDTSNMASIAKNKEAIAGIAMGLAGMSASVKFGDFVPRAVTGTKVKVVPHIPMGAGFHPAFAASVAKNHGKAFLGSLFVAADGDPMVGSFHLNYDCWDIGVVDLFKSQRAGGKKAPEPGGPQAELFVPSGTVLPIPWGRPVLVNSIPTPINPMAILDRLFKAGLSKLKAAGRRAVERGLTNLRGRVGCGTLTAVSRAIGTGQSHPVDVSGGYFYTDNKDFKLPGPIPLIWERVWYSNSNYNGPLGYGWHHSYDMALGIDKAAGTAVVRMADGRPSDFRKLPAKGDYAFNRSEKLLLHLHEEGYYYATDQNNLIYRFTTEEYKNPFNGTEAHLLQSIANRNGFAIRLIHDFNGFLTKIIDSAGRELIINNDHQGRITSIHAPDPRFGGRTTFTIASYTYSEEGDLGKHADALDQPMWFEYKNHLLVKEIWRNNLAWNFRYDKDSGADVKCIEVWGDDNLLHYTFDYKDPQCTIATNSLGFKKFFYHRNGVVIKHIDSLDAAWEYHYNQYNELEWEIDPLGNQKTTTYDKWGNIESITEANGAFTQTTYGDGLLRHSRLEFVDVSGGKWQWAYDNFGNIIKRTDSLKQETKYSYTDGLLNTLTNAQGIKTSFNYDTNYNLIEEIYSANYSHRWTFDALGNCIKSVDASGNTRKLQFDLILRPIQINEPDGNIRLLEYDAEGNITQDKDNQYDIKFSYNHFNQVKSRSQAGYHVHYKYDTECSLVQITNEVNENFTFEKNAVGKIIKETGFDGVVTEYTRDIAGRIIKAEKPGISFKHFSYDEVGKISSINYHDNSFENYEYSKDGRVISAENNHSFIKIERSNEGYISKESSNFGSIDYVYNAIGNRLQISSSLGAEINNKFNISGNLVETNANGWDVVINYNEFGLETKRFLPGNVVAQWKRDKLGRPLSQYIEGKGLPLHNRHYTWDVNHRIIEIKDTTAGQIQLVHDESGNLSETIYNRTFSEFRNPDAAGNIYKSANRLDRRYGKAGRLLETNGNNYKYDEEGNLTDKISKDKKKWKYIWNAQGLLQAVIRPDKDAVAFTYDAFGRRLTKTYKNTVTKWQWDGNRLLHEWKEHLKTGAILSNSNVNQDGIITWMFNEKSLVPIAKLKGNKAYSIITDYVGTPFHMYNAAGEKVWETHLDSYGKSKVHNGDNDSCPFRFQGQYEDAETGLYYNRFRYYDNEDGIYLKQDPLGIWGSMRPYGYVKDPAIQVDIFGLAAATCSVYHLYDLDENGRPIGHPYYVGITEDDRTRTRQDEHERSGRLTTDGTTGMVVAQSGLTPEQARGVEQAHIDHYGTQTGTRRGTVLDDGSVHDGAISQENRGNKNNSFVENDTRDTGRQNEMVQSRDAETNRLQGN